MKNKVICFTKHGNIINEYQKLTDVWKENCIELIWDINRIASKYKCIVVSQNGDDNLLFVHKDITLIMIKNLHNKTVRFFFNKVYYLINLFFILYKEKITHFIPADSRGFGLFIIFCKLLDIIVVPNISRENHVTRFYLLVFKILKVKDFIVPGYYYKTILTKLNNRNSVYVRQPSYPDSFFTKTNLCEFQNGDFNVLFASRLIKAKGIYEFLDAAISISRKKLNITFYILGDGIEYETVKNIITHNGLEQKILMLGNKDNLMIGNYLLNSDVLVFPTYTEGFAKSWIEAILTHTPMILTPINAIKELLTDNHNCLYIPVKSDKAIESAIIKLFENKDLYKKIKSNLSNIEDLLIEQKQGNFEECVLKLIV